MERIGGRVSVEAYQGWIGFGRVHHVSTTGLLDAMGRWLGEQDAPTGRLPRWLREVIADGQSVDDARRARRGR